MLSRVRQYYRNTPDNIPPISCHNKRHIIRVSLCATRVFVTRENKIFGSTANTLHRRNVCICAPEIVYLFIFRPRSPLRAALPRASSSEASLPPPGVLALFARPPAVCARVRAPKRTTIFMCSVATIEIIYAFYIWKSRPLSRPWSLVFLPLNCFYSTTDLIIFL